jgi:hypothetical protein
MAQSLGGETQAFRINEGAAGLPGGALSFSRVFTAVA